MQIKDLTGEEIERVYQRDCRQYLGGLSLRK